MRRSALESGRYHFPFLILPPIRITENTTTTITAEIHRGESTHKPELSVEKALRMIENGECGCFNPLLIECLKQTAEKLKTDVYES